MRAREGGGAGTGRRTVLTPYLLLLPLVLWLAAFFLVPLVTLLMGSLQSGSFNAGYVFTFEASNYTAALSAYWPWFVRSFLYAGVATVAALVIAYPLAYMIAFKAGRFRHILLVVVIAPFFASFLVRTLAWTTLLADTGPLVSALRAVGLLGPDQWLLASPLAVVCGLTYNFLPFMVLPLYASLDRLDLRMVEAAGDLYAPGFSAFRRVTLPLSMPGVVAGTLLTFIPASGDFVNAQLLGGTDTQMIGNVIESQYLRVLDFPAASTLSVVLIVAITVLVTAYVRWAGTEDVV
jgi:spermidine/putrescine transport system permease protein